jgi:hypothetical protein
MSLIPQLALTSKLRAAACRESLSITAAQLLHVNLPQCSPLKKGGTAAAWGAVDGATAAASMPGGAER